VDFALGARFARNPVFRHLGKGLGVFSLAWAENIFIHNLTKPFPWTAGSVDVVYTSHTLEHFTREEGQFIIAESFRVLKPGGLIRIIVPDLREIINRYVNQALAADHFVEELGVLYQTSRSPLKAKLIPFIQFPHKCMYDTETLLHALDRSGFRAASWNPFDSGIADIAAIESSGRTVAAVIVEGVKAGAAAPG
jgi:ubiquinone/menaquinone biosynthesis C-methylase UbiE